MAALLRKIVFIVTRRGIETVVASGTLIVASLVVGQWVDAQSLADGLMTAAAVVAGFPVAIAAYGSIRTGHVGIEVLVTIAAVGALLIGERWEAAAVTFLFNLGGFLEGWTMARTRRVISNLLSLAPARATVIRDGLEQIVGADEVAVGETVIVKPGERIPVDGTVAGGQSRVDESSITGESYPVRKERDTQVFTGTFNQTGMLTITAHRVGEDTTLARIIQRVEEAQEAKAPTERFMDRFSRTYTPAIILLSLGVFAVTRDISFALTVLVIGCPGALVISTPVSIVAGIGGAAKRGILMKGGAHLERSGMVTAVAFDKTGTLTTGRPEVTAVHPVNSGDPLYWAAVAERGSEHPIAGAITRYAGLDDTSPRPDSVDAIPGRGIVAEVGGEFIAVGNTALMADRGIQWPKGMADHKGTEVLVARGEHALGTIVIADPVRPDAAAAVTALKRNGVQRIVMLTGDNRETAQIVASQIGIDEVYAEMLPEEKLNHIRQLMAEGYVTAMVGDGINDTPALATADVGIAVGAAGTDAAIETADIALMRDDLSLVTDAIVHARKTLRNIRQNVVIALVTVGALLAGVLTGNIHMAGGMLIHEASVMVVILNGMRLLHGRFKLELPSGN